MHAHSQRRRLSPCSDRWPAAAREGARLGAVAAFTLVEIMVVVVIIGILAALGLPALQRIHERSTASRLANDFRQFEAAFQRYTLENGQWPPPAAAGVIPPGMNGFLPESFSTAPPLGGNFQWSGPSHNVVLRGSSATDAVMQCVDAILDDGDLTTGNFRKTAGVGFHLLVP
jgi:prepilin-type N-terminal cleavage/methylation domain-containing protein